MMLQLNCVMLDLTAYKIGSQQVTPKQRIYVRLTTSTLRKVNQLAYLVPQDSPANKQV